MLLVWQETYIVQRYLLEHVSPGCTNIFSATEGGNGYESENSASLSEQLNFHDHGIYTLWLRKDAINVNWTSQTMNLSILDKKNFL